MKMPGPMLLVSILSLAIRVAAAPVPPESRAANQTDGGKWQLSIHTSPTDGSQSVSATLPANTPIRSGFGEVTPSLVLRYQGGRVSAYVVFDTYLGGGDTLDAWVTFGSQPPDEQKWRISSDSRAAFVPGEALAFIERLKQEKTFAVRVSPRKDSFITAAFTTTGIDVVIKALISAGVKYSR